MSEPSGDDDWISEVLAKGLLDADSADADPAAVERPNVDGPDVDGPAGVPTSPISTPPVSAPPVEVTPVQAGSAPADEVRVPESEPSPIATAPRPDDVTPDWAEPADLETNESPREAVEPEEDDQRSSLAKGLIEWVVVLVGAVAVALVLRAFLFQAFWIPSESMESTLQLHDRVLVNKLSYRLHDVNRGDVVVFRRPDDEPSEIRDLIKRVIALEGETVEGRDNTIYIDGKRLIEGYLAPDEVILPFGPVTVEPGHVFVMGDNRDQSLDSRFFGAIPEDRIVGRAFVLFWPLDRIGTL